MDLRGEVEMIVTARWFNAFLPCGDRRKEGEREREENHKSGNKNRLCPEKLGESRKKKGAQASTYFGVGRTSANNFIFRGECPQEEEGEKQWHSMTCRLRRR